MTASHTLYPTRDEALLLHALLIETFGGAPGVRDLGALESALYRPQSGFYQTLSEQAAALLQSLARNHAFVDGNKRVAFAMCAIFLRMNGYRLQVPADEGERFLVERVIVSHADVREIADWLSNGMTAT